MARPRQIRITRQGWLYTAIFLAVLIGATSRQLNLLMLIGCVMAGPLVLNLLYGRWALRRLTVERRLPAHLHAGQRLRVELSIANQRRWPGLWGVRLSDTIERDDPIAIERDRVGVFFPHVPAGDARQGSYQGFLPRRGRYLFGPLEVSTRFPMGLVQHNLRWPEADEQLLVHPRLGRLQPGWAKLIRENESGSQRMTRRGMLEADFYGLREWRPGDSRRWIHWRTSARRGSIIVRQFEQGRSQNLAILVDLWQPAEPTDAERERVETAISVVATILAEVCRKPGAQLHLEIAAQQTLRESGSGSPVFLREQMDALALLMPHAEPSFPTELGHALALISAATPTFVIGTRPIDWDVLRAAALERDTPIDSRRIADIDVAGPELSRFYQHPTQNAPAESVA